MTYNLKRRNLFRALLESPEIKSLAPHAYDLVIALAKRLEEQRIEAKTKDAELIELRKQVSRLTTANETLSRSMATILEKHYASKKETG